MPPVLLGMQSVGVAICRKQFANRSPTDGFYLGSFVLEPLSLGHLSISVAGYEEVDGFGYTVAEFVGKLMEKTLFLHV